MYFNIKLDSSVKHLTKVACMALSGYIQNGLALTDHPTADIIIYKDRIDFGKCLRPELWEVSGLLSPILPMFPNFYKEYQNIIYRYISNFSFSSLTKTLDFTGVFPPTEPDNEEIFKLLYPRFQ
jgi:hypothetical protein